MRVRDHVALSTAAAGLLYPRLRSSVFAAWAASVLIDVDHYAWFVVRNRRLNPVTAVRSFNGARSAQHSETRLLHHPTVVLTLLLLGTRRRAILLPALGMAFHVGLDIYHRARTHDARAAALSRDRFTCQVCGTQGPGVVAHLWRQPRLLPSYRVDHFVSVCGACHETAHSGKAVVPVECDWDSYLERTGLGARLRGPGRESSRV